jgi:hypothetical protein
LKINVLRLSKANIQLDPQCTLYKKKKEREREKKSFLILYGASEFFYYHNIIYLILTDTPTTINVIQIYLDKNRRQLLSKTMIKKIALMLAKHYHLLKALSHRFDPILIKRKISTFYFFYCFIIHMCIQGLGHFSPLPPPPPLPPTLPPPSPPHPLNTQQKLFCPYF